MNDIGTAAKQLLGALDKSLYMNDYCGLEVSKHDQPDVTDAIENLRAALAEPQEPVAWGLFAKVGGEFVLQHPVRFSEIDVEDDRLMYARDTATEIRPLYTAQPQRSATV